jgi:WhiB family transcriptional regulator, redox-sensing transcriptional regulator
MTRDGVELDPLSPAGIRGPLRASRPGSNDRKSHEKHAGPKGLRHRIMRPFLDAWQDLALCKGQDTEKWYPEGVEPDRHALATCFSCPVRRECATHALFRPEPHGIWGASTETQRARVWRAIRNGLVTKEEAVDTLMDISDDDGIRRRLIA